MLTTVRYPSETLRQSGQSPIGKVGPRPDTGVFGVSIENSDGQQRLAAQQRCEIGNRLDDCARLETELFGHFGGAALNPECVQSSGGGAVDVPRIRRDEPELRVR